MAKNTNKHRINTFIVENKHFLKFLFLYVLYCCIVHYIFQYFISINFPYYSKTFGQNVYENVV